jgi:YrbI family 3-deoxy-D-manno-octulosonate 8-phosphate phosphatase
MIKLIIFDVDGVVTNGNVIVDEDARECKEYNLNEIDAINNLKENGYMIAAITGDNSPIVNIFKERIKWDAFISNCKKKKEAIKQLEIKFSVNSNSICYIGDGKYDVDALKYVGLGVAPNNAIEEAKIAADVVLKGNGGRDCIQELQTILRKKYNLSKIEYTHRTVIDRFMLGKRVCVITGGAGLMGYNHAEAVLSGDGIPVLLDISQSALYSVKEKLLNHYPESEIYTYCVDITNRCALENVKDDLTSSVGHIDILINNAANNPKMEHSSKNMGAIPFQDFPLSSWREDIAVGLTGALMCTQVFGNVMVQQRKGVILNISSDLGIIAPDQRIYRKDDLRDEEQTIKPVTYSVIKHGLIGLTKYTATYWADKGVRCNALCPAGIENGQDEVFIKKLTNLIPMGRMATKDEYQSTVLYMISDASAYMTGATVIVDGGRTCW